jgi:hypothetical protein
VVLPEHPREGRRARKAATPGHGVHVQLAAHQPPRGALQAHAAHGGGQRFAAHGVVHAVEVARRQAGHLGQLRQVQGLVQVLFDVG